MAGRRIVVTVAEWEQACCGAPFAVDGNVEWQLSAADPTAGSLPLPEAVRGLGRFVEEHHDQTPADVPQVAVSGVVRAIWGVRYAEVAVPGERATFTIDMARGAHEPLDAVGRGGGGFVEYLVELEVAAGVELPAYVLSEDTVAWRAARARDRDRDVDRMRDAVGVILERAIDEAVARYAGVADIERSPDRGAVTVTPRRSGAVGVRWARSGGDVDGIGVHVGAASWWLNATTTDARSVVDVLAAAARGDVVDDIVLEDGGARRLETRVRVDGIEWTATTGSVPAFRGGAGGVGGVGGVMLVAGDAWERAQRGRVDYASWEV